MSEVLASALKLRSKTLREGIDNLLEDPQLAGLSQDFYSHPLIKKLAQDGSRPSYISARDFTLALSDLLKKKTGVKTGSLYSQAEHVVDQLPKGDLKTALSALVDDADGKAKAVRKNLEAWFDSSMNRVSGWYKRKAQKILLLMAGIVTMSLNVDAVEVAKAAWTNPTLRAALVAQAEGVDRSDHLAIKDQMEALGIDGMPIGWDQWSRRFREAGTRWPEVLGQSVVGWLITILAASLGAPFWFDGLQKLLNVRSAGKRPAAKGA